MAETLANTMLDICSLKMNTTYNLGKHIITAQEIINFGSAFDPQIYHTNPELAKKSEFSGLIASGWHLTSIWMNLYVRSLIINTKSLGSPGVDLLRWFSPVRPCEELTAKITIIQKTPSMTNKTYEIYHQRAELTNSLNLIAVSFVIYGLFPHKKL